MHVTLVSGSLGPGGAERNIIFLANALAPSHRVTLIVLDSLSQPFFPLSSRVSLVFLGKLDWEGRAVGLRALLRTVLMMGRMRKQIKTLRPDVVISFIHWVNITTILSTLGLSVCRIISERTNVKAAPVRLAVRVARFLSYPLAQALVVPSQGIRVRVRLPFGPKCIVIPNPALGFRGTNALEITQTSGGPISLISMGRLSSEKGFDLLIEAFDLLKRDFPDIELAIWGEGPARPQLEALIREKGLCGMVRLPGLTTDPLTPLKKADVFVLSSRFEGFPNVLCEAMAAGVPAVSFDCPCGPSEIIRDGVDGMLVSPGDVKKLAQALEELLRDAEKRKRMGERAKEILLRFSPESVVARWEALLKELVYCTEDGESRQAPTPKAAASAIRDMNNSAPNSPTSNSSGPSFDPSTSIRVLHLLDHLGLGGAQGSVLDILEALPPQVAAQLFVLRRDAHERETTYPHMMKYPSYSRISLAPLFTLRSICRSRNISILHAHLFRSQVFSWLSKLFFAPRIRLIFHERGNIWESGFLQRRLLRLMAKKVDCFICVSEATRQKLLSVLGTDLEARARVLALPNGVDIAKIQRAGARAADSGWIRDTLKISPNTFLLGFFGRLEPQKGLEFLFEALSRVERDYYLLICGEGSLEGSLRKLARRLGIENRISFLGYRADSPQLMASVQAVAIPSSWEPFPRVALEAQALGVPIIGTDVDGIPEVVGPQARALLVPWGDASLFAQRAREFAENEELRQSLIAEGREYVSQFDIKSYVARLMACYRELETKS